MSITSNSVNQFNDIVEHVPSQERCFLRWGTEDRNRNNDPKSQETKKFQLLRKHPPRCGWSRKLSGRQVQESLGLVKSWEISSFQWEKALRLMIARESAKAKDYSSSLGKSHGIRKSTGVSKFLGNLCRLTASNSRFPVSLSTQSSYLVIEELLKHWCIFRQV
ncbi:hypothetical protein Tco_0032429 [Tanacetum coccineum]